MKPPTDNCPFCKATLDTFTNLSEFTQRWYCKNCKCDGDESMPRYAVVCFEPDGQCAYLQEFGIGPYYIKNNYHGRETKILKLTKYLITSEIIIPFKEWDLSDEEAVKQKLRLYLTFS